MADTPQAVAHRREYYFQMMRKARQLNDRVLIRLILKKLTRLGRTGTMTTAGGCAIIPFPAIQAPAETLDQEPYILDFPTSNFNKGKDKMDKKPLVYYGLVALVLIGLVVFLSLYISPEDINYFNYLVESTKPIPIKVTASVDHGAQKALGISLIGAFCMIMLAGYLFWAFYRKIQKNRQTDPLTMENYLYDISLETGRNEYDLFCKSAGNWAISGDRIDYDFKRYLIDQSLPYYVKDFVRKNHEHVDESLIKKEELKPTSIWDYAIALLVFPGCLLFLVLMPILFLNRAFFF